MHKKSIQAPAWMLFLLKCCFSELSFWGAVPKRPRGIFLVLRLVKRKKVQIKSGFAKERRRYLLDIHGSLEIAFVYEWEIVWFSDLGKYFVLLCSFDLLL